MKKSDKKFLDIISSAIRGEKFNYDKNENIDWRAILSKAREHDVTGLVYYSLDENSKSIIEKEPIEELKRDAILSGIFQMRAIFQIKNILIEFEKNKLTPIVLKGPSLKELYPLPELRTMSDLDLLIKSDEFTEAQIIMEQIGYVKIKGDGGHLEYVKKGAISVELHLAHHFKGIREREESFWDDCIEINSLNTNARALSLENSLVYLCIHMAKHISILGIGIRQLCDFTLFIEKNCYLINWDKVIEKISIYNLENFFFIMIKICNESLNLYIPDEILDRVNTFKYNYKKLINHILDGGVFGKKYIRIFETLSDKYKYCKKHRSLLIIAWIKEIMTVLKDKEKLVFLLKAPFNFVIFSIKRKQICRKIYL